MMTSEMHEIQTLIAAKSAKTIIAGIFPRRKCRKRKHSAPSCKISCKNEHRTEKTHKNPRTLFSKCDKKRVQNLFSFFGRFVFFSLISQETSTII